MKTFLRIFFIFISIQSVFAQDKIFLNISFAPEITGQTHAVITGLKSKPDLGYTSGLQANLFPFKHFGFFLGVNYFHKKLKYGLKDVRVDDESDEFYLELKNNNYFFKEALKENYLESTAGILLRTLPKKMNFFCSLGISFSMLMNQYDPISNETYSRSQLKDGATNTNFLNGIAGLGVQYKLTGNLGLNAEATTRYAFIPMIDKSQLFPGVQMLYENAHTITAGLKLGLAYMLK